MQCILLVAVLVVEVVEESSELWIFVIIELSEIIRDEVNLIKI